MIFGLMVACEEALDHLNDSCDLFVGQSLDRYGGRTLHPEKIVGGNPEKLCQINNILR